MTHTSSRRNTRTGLVLAGVAVGMVGLAFASVPLYDLFRQATGFGGTAQVMAKAPQSTVARTMVIRFNTDVDPKLSWSFQPNQRQVSLQVGETGQVTYTTRNLEETPVTGTATFNVTPIKAGKYFNKVQCFCFDAQRLDAGQKAEMAVRFFVDPAIMDDRNLDEVKTITLSFTFFRDRGEGRDEDERDGGDSAANTRQDNRQSAAAQSGAPTID